jgi:hypothetical protein
MKRFYIFTALMIGMVCSFIYGQTIVSVDNFKPYERMGDTIYFNRNHYEFVLSTQTNTKYGFNRKLHHLSSLEDLYRTEKIYPYTVKIKGMSWSSLPDDNECDICRTKVWYFPGIVTVKDIKIKKNDIAYYLEETKLLFPGMHKDTVNPKINLSLDLFPELDPILKKFYQFLSFENHQQYSVWFEFGDSINTTVDVPVLCNPEIHGTGPRYNGKELKHILDSMITNVHWPVLKVENAIIPYKTSKSEIEMIDYIGAQLENQQSLPNLRPLFINKDSILVRVDSLNYLSTLFIPGQQNEKYPTGYSSTVTGIIKFDQELFDINNDGRKDFVLDTTEIYTFEGGVANKIEYIPDYATTSQYSFALNENLVYSEDLGNHYYYSLINENEASIFFVKNNNYIKILNITSDFLDKKGEAHYRQFKHCTVYKNTDLTATYPAFSKKAYKMQTLLEEKIKYYLQHPEKLPIDFPMN